MGPKVCDCVKVCLHTCIGHALTLMCSAVTIGKHFNGDTQYSNVEYWKLNPLLAAPGLWQHKAEEIVNSPYKHTTTQRFIDIIAKLVKQMGHEARFKGRKTLLLREAGFVIMFLAGGELFSFW